MHGKDEKIVQKLVGKPTEKDHLEDLGIVEMMVLIVILKSRRRVGLSCGRFL
jgi:hypothetical protein